MNAEIEVGDKVRFVPCANYDHSAGFADILMREVTGTVVQVHEAHRWYRVEYERGGARGYECFKLGERGGEST